MTQAEKQVWVSRVKSFTWRASGVGVIAALNWALQNVGLLEWHNLTVGTMVVDPTQWLTVILGLITGEITKYYNTNKAWIVSVDGEGE